VDRADRHLALALRVCGGVTLLALPCAVMPRSWMEATHAVLGLGEMPSGPIVDYLARSMSLLYAFFGVLALVLASDVRRYRPLIETVAILSILLGPAFLAVDLSAGLPWHWVLGDGPVVVAIGVGLWYLVRRVPAVETEELKR
jgi:hypothetical protein